MLASCMQLKDTTVRINAASTTLCHLCRITFPANEIIKHQREHHAKDQRGVSQTKKFVCNVCGKPQISFAHLQRHMTTHSSEKPFSCPICNKSYKRHDVMKRHLLTHAKARLVRKDF